MPRLSPDHVLSGKYRVLECLGAGGMGEVYRAWHELAGRAVALKLLRSDLADDPDLLRRFFQEAQAVNKVRHPNIVDVLDADYSASGPYVVMECLEGATLGALLQKRARFSPAETATVLLPVLDALEAAHRHGIVHRDLKPENVFVARFGDEVRVKLVDFGIAKVLGTAHGPSPRTGTGVVFGTPDYLSPEQASGEGVVDGRSDLFAVGTLAFELMTGRRPFEAPSAVATAYKIVHSPAPSLESMGVHGEPLAQRVLDMALAKSKDARFASASAFAEALAPLAPEPSQRQAMLRGLFGGTAGPTRPAPAEDARDGGGEVALQPTERPSAEPILRAIGATPRIPSPPPRITPSREAPSTPARWTPRSIPIHVRGKCHMRGTLPRAVKRWIEREYGPAGVERALSMLPPDIAHAFRTDAYNALLWHDIEPLDLMMDATTFSLLGGEVKQWRELAREHFDADLGTIFRAAGRRDTTTLVQRLPEKIGRVLDFGAVKIGKTPEGNPMLRFDSFEAASLALRYALLGTVEGMLRSAAVEDASVKILSGEASFVRELEIEVTWKQSARVT
jgi:serine/threonine-protein kinase